MDALATACPRIVPLRVAMRLEYLFTDVFSDFIVDPTTGTNEASGMSIFQTCCGAMWVRSKLLGRPSGVVTANCQWRVLLVADEGRKVVCIADNDAQPVARLRVALGRTLAVRGAAWVLHKVRPRNEPIHFSRLPAIAAGRIKDVDLPTKIWKFREHVHVGVVGALEARAFANRPADK